MGTFLNFPVVIASETKQSRVVQDSSGSPRSFGARDDSYIEHEVVAKIAPDTDTSVIAVKYNLNIELLKTSSDGNLYILKSRDGINPVSTAKLIRALKKDSAIISVQPNFKYKPLARVANDKYFSQEWALADTNTFTGGVSAPSAWDLETKNKKNSDRRHRYGNQLQSAGVESCHHGRKSEREEYQQPEEETE